MLLVCGREDPLAQGAKLVHRLLSNNDNTKTQCELFLCNGLHSFHGMPIHLTHGRWENESFVATKKIIKYLTNGDLDIQIPSRDQIKRMELVRLIGCL